MPRAPFNVLVYPYQKLTDGGIRYALFKRSDEAWWQGVAGGGEDNETPLQAAARETLEESGIPVDNPFLKLSTVIPVPVTHFPARAFWADDLFVIPEYCFGVLFRNTALVLSPEHTEYRWLHYLDAQRLLRFEGDRTALWELHSRLHGGGTVRPFADQPTENQSTQTVALDPMVKRGIIGKPTGRRRAEFLAAANRSRKLHGRWTSAPRTSAEFDLYLKRVRQKTHLGYWVLSESGEIAGVINISNIVRGVFCSGYLGYYVFAPHNGKGYMTRGLAAVMSDAFRIQGLHRLEANIQPGNVSSRALAQRLGFRLEGLSPRYLKIAGRWCDHERWALTIEDWKAAKAAGRTR